MSNLDGRLCLEANGSDGDENDDDDDDDAIIPSQVTFQSMSRCSNT